MGLPSAERVVSPLPGGPAVAEPVLDGARGVAAHVLHRVDDQGAFASRALDAELRRANLDTRDSGLSTELVYGTLRALPQIDAAYGRFLRQPPEQLDSWLKAVLRSATYELIGLKRKPPHGVVHTSVDIVRMKRGQSLARVCNAILRRVAENADDLPCDRHRLSVPEWLARNLRESLGDERAETFLTGRAHQTETGPPPMGIRIHRHRTTRDRVIQALSAQRPKATLQPSQLLPHAILAKSLGNPRDLGPYQEGDFSLQELGAQLVTGLVPLKPGEKVADLCAGHGGKTLYFLERLENTGSKVVAIDIDDRSLDKMVPAAERIHLNTANLQCLAVDLTVGTANVPQDFDVVFADVPCTGLGTVHRRPEILLRVEKEDPRRMGKIQTAILARAAQLVRPGGTLWYSVCSPTQEEGLQVAQAFEAQCPQFQRINPQSNASTATTDCSAPVERDPDGAHRIGPWLEDCDIYQLFGWNNPIS